MKKNNLVGKIGFACKWVELQNAKSTFKALSQFNTKQVRLSWAHNKKRQVVEEHLIQTVKSNTYNIQNLVKIIGQQTNQLKMVRISSDIIPFYNHDEWKQFWKRNINFLEKCFEPIGKTARQQKIRISFHPDQYVALASENQQIVQNSLAQFEYHADMAKWMGYGKKFQDLKINIHINGRKGVQGMRQAYKRLSPEARNVITVENSEFIYGVDEVLQLRDLMPTVLDIHHHWINTGQYIALEDSRISKIIQSWKGIRPTMHYSISKEELISKYFISQKPNFQQLLGMGFNKQQLKSHSDFYWNDEVNRWAVQFLAFFDMMCQAKAKNLASFQFYEKYVK